MKRQPDESAALQALRESLTENDGGHPAEELLLVYSDARSSLAWDVVERIDTHLAECASCRDEVGVLGSVTISPVREASAAAAQTEPTFWQRIVSALSGPVWRPALAFAVLLVLMVPTLRMIGRDRAMLFESIEHHDDVAMTVNTTPQFERPRANEVGAAAGAVERKSKEQTGREAERRAITDALVPPTPSAHREVTAPSTPGPPSAAVADAPPSPAPAPPADDEARMAERQMWAARESDSRLRNAFAARGMAKQRVDEPRSLALTLDYVPGGRVSIAPDLAEHVTLRILFVRDGSSVDTRSDGTVVGRAGAGVVLAPSVTEVDVVVIAADGRRNSQRVEVGTGQAGAMALLVEIPVDWLAAGGNHIDILDRDGRRLDEAAFVIECPQTAR